MSDSFDDDFPPSPDLQTVEQLTTTDVVYLDICLSKFRVPAAILGLFPDSFLMTMFPAGVIPFFSIVCPDSPPPPPIRNRPPRPPSRSQHNVSSEYNLNIEEDGEQKIQLTTSENSAASNATTPATLTEKYNSLESYYYKAFGRGYYDFEFPDSAMTDPLDDIEDSKMVVVQNFDPRMFRFLVDHFRQVLAVNADRQRRNEAIAEDKFELEMASGIGNGLVNEENPIPFVDTSALTVQHTALEQDSKNGDNIGITPLNQINTSKKSMWKFKKSQKPLFKRLSGLKQTVTQLFSNNSARAELKVKEHRNPIISKSVTPSFSSTKPTTLSEHKQKMMSAIQSILVLREEVEYFIFPGNIILEDELPSDAENSVHSTRPGSWQRLFKWKSKAPRFDSSFQTIPYEISDSSLKTNTSVIAALKNLCANKLVAESRIGHQYAVPALSAALLPSSVASSPNSSRVSLQLPDDRKPRKSFTRFSIAQDDEPRPRASKDFRRVSREAKRRSFDTFPRINTGSNQSSLDRKFKGRKLSASSQPDFSEILEPAPEELDQKKLLSESKKFQQGQHLQFLQSLATLTEFNPEKSDWQYRAIELSKSRLVSLSMLAMRDSELIEVLKSDPEHSKMLDRLKDHWLDGAVGSDILVENPSKTEMELILVNENVSGSTSSPSLITSVINSGPANTKASIAENIMDRKSVRRCWWEVLVLRVDMEELDAMVRKSVNEILALSEEFEVEMEIAGSRSRRSSSIDVELKKTISEIKSSRQSSDLPSQEKDDGMSGAILEVRVWLRRSWTVEFCTL
ncbi:hypothetical protein HK096_008080 [Nowakowskiella sp. JEL0078]|nr:hypothetical protein HK096_008080 [Nowakowskiella sp. JEL0078]